MNHESAIESTLERSLIESVLLHAAMTMSTRWFTVQPGTYEPPVRIALAGASGTGKTTTARIVSLAMGVPINPVGSRSVASVMGFEERYAYETDVATLSVYLDALRDGGIATPAAMQEAAANARNHFAQFQHTHAALKPPTVRSLFQRVLARSKRAWESTHESFVSDRSVMDDFVYAAMHNGHSSTGMMPPPEVVAHAATVRTWLFQIDDFLHLDGDPARVQDRSYHEHFERDLRSHLPECSVAIRGTAAARAESIIGSFNLPRAIVVRGDRVLTADGVLPTVAAAKAMLSLPFSCLTVATGGLPVFSHWNQFAGTPPDGMSWVEPAKVVKWAPEVGDVIATA